MTSFLIFFDFYQSATIYRFLLFRKIVFDYNMVYCFWFWRCSTYSKYLLVSPAFCVCVCLHFGFVCFWANLYNFQVYCISWNRIKQFKRFLIKILLSHFVVTNVYFSHSDSQWHKQSSKYQLLPHNLNFASYFYFAN